MSSGRICRSARRGIAAAVLGWLCVAVASVVMAPTAAAAPSATVEIRNITPPVVSVDPGGKVTFVNKVAPLDTSVSVPLVGSVSASVTTDVTVTFFGQERSLAPDAATDWTFPATTAGSIEYTYTVTPQPGLSAAVADQVVDLVAATLPSEGAPVTVPYTVQTLAPDVPNLPSVNVPALPSVEIPPLPELPVLESPDDDGGPRDTEDGDDRRTDGPEPIDAEPYTYPTGAGAPTAAAADGVAAAAFDPSRFSASSAPSGAGSGAGAGAGGLPGGYDGASVPVFGQLAGLDGTRLDGPWLDEQEAGERLATSGSTEQTLPAAALAAVVALATATAALVRTHQVQRSSKG
jgi:hypothetical protein